MLSENFYRRLASVRFRIAKLAALLRRRNRPMADIGALLRDYAQAKADLEAFLGIGNDQFWQLMEAWPQIEEALFHNKRDLMDFYCSWNGDNGRANLCANVFNQFLSADIYFAVRPHVVAARRVLDYGCGTASVTLAHAMLSAGRTEFVLVELQDMVRQFIQFRVERHHLPRVRSIDLAGLSGEAAFDLVMCIDVLEHLENPSQVFIEDLVPRVALGGLLILRAPWRGQLTHIDAAPEDFYGNGGRVALARHFVEIERIGANDLDAVYKRIR
ncbi:methyltransferase domain-containing protein [Haematospirillum sp. H1815]|uniref:class I SAM-dependent methyltransferase n=1 Tax=Haematospirillum sp. H1815 TaxID=2723108 RepID=UPI00143AE973|nr:methyltransferase [Haematospirillum sp. H1815]NKD76845.1 methyltransferase domain-containing protein [Haematospirillum sp. H1815]